MTRRSYNRIAIEPVKMESRSAILASSVNNNSTVSSVGQEVGTEVDLEFKESEYINSNWESGSGI